MNAEIIKLSYVSFEFPLRKLIVIVFCLQAVNIFAAFAFLKRLLFLGTLLYFFYLFKADFSLERTFEKSDIKNSAVKI